MNALDVSALVNTIGFAAGLSLYAMLLVMVLGGPTSAVRVLNSSIAVPTFRIPAERLALTTGLLGLLWNVAELVVYISRDLQNVEPSPVVVAVGFTALGFLPAVVVHSAIESPVTGRSNGLGTWVRRSAYGLSATGAAFQAVAALTRTSGTVGRRPATPDDRFSRRHRGTVRRVARDRAIRDVRCGLPRSVSSRSRRCT